MTAPLLVLTGLVLFQVKTARTVHDQKLDRWGARTMTHSTNEVPYDKRLAKKKKFNKKNPFKVVLNDPKIVGTGVEKEQYIKVWIKGFTTGVIAVFLNLSVL